MFYEKLPYWNDRFNDAWTYSPKDKAMTFNSVINKDLLSIHDLTTLLSPKSDKALEQMAVRANREAACNFGKTIQLFTPLYLGNYCDNRCVYCAFNKEYSVKRKVLNMTQVQDECLAIASSGLDEVLLLTGESRKHTDVPYLCECSRIALKHFSSVGIEVYPLETSEYRQLIDVGVSGLTLYQETYDEAVYDQLHLSGPKKDFRYRLEGPERGAMAGMNKIQIGALLGLSDPFKDAYLTAAHLWELMKAYPEVEWGLSIPRLKAIENASFQGTSVSDRDFVHILLALRLLFPKVSISLSTRESAIMRSHLIPLGINRLSAGVSTSVGRLASDDDTSQFEISDHSSVHEVKSMVTNLGYQVVFSNWLPIKEAPIYERL